MDTLPALKVMFSIQINKGTHKRVPHTVQRSILLCCQMNLWLIPAICPKVL